MYIKYRTLIYLLPVLVMLISCCNTRNRNLETTDRYFEKIKKEGDRAGLTMFFTQMPKGGDLHHHYSGALYVETYLDWAAAEHFQIDTITLKLDTAKVKSPESITVDKLRKESALYRAVVDMWSDEDFCNNFHLQNPPDQHFFNTFHYFGPISGTNYKDGLAEIKQEAELENVQYIETMLNYPLVEAHFRPGLSDSRIDGQGRQDTVLLFRIFNLFTRSLQSSKAYDSAITAYLASLHNYHEGMDDSGFTMRFQSYSPRTIPAAKVFATLFGAFDAAERDKSAVLVGVNIVAPENDLVSMRDYWLHMQMFRFLKRKFPSVKTAMHAGELCLGMVKPQDLTYHIYDAVFIAGANRIGHGVDIPYETQAPQILQKMKSDSIPVEINLSSNEFILGIKGEDHPINLYYDAGVPIVISTDDPGVSRNNLSYEYVLLASGYHFSYKQIKSFVFNSIKYSFLKENEKAALETKLSARFEAFEAEITATAARHK
jgi:adenosine deaminase